MTNDEQTNPLLRMSLAELWELFPIILSPFNPLWKEWYFDIRLLQGVLYKLV